MVPTIEDQYFNGLSRYSSSELSQEPQDLRYGSKFPGFASVWDAQRILTLDGGGVRGLSSLYILQELMRLVADFERALEPCAQSSTSSPLFRPVKLSARSPDASRRTFEESSPSQLPYKPCHYFDYICGVSVGGVSATLLGVMQFTVEETIDRTQRILDGLTPKVSKNPLSFHWSRNRTDNFRKLDRNLRSTLEEPYADEDFCLHPRATDSASNFHIEPIDATLEADESMCQT